MDGRTVVRVLLAEEMAMVREGLALLVESSGSYRVAGQCGDGPRAIELMRTLQPDIAVIDLNLPRLYPLELIRQARRLASPPKIIVTATREDRKTVLETLRVGASGFLLKSGPARQLHDAFQQVMGGAVYVSPLLELNHILVAGSRQRSSEDPLELLSGREFQVYSLLVEGTRAKEIAARLELSPKTVDTYRASLMRKLDIHDVAGLVRFAMLRGTTVPATSLREKMASAQTA